MNEQQTPQKKPNIIRFPVSPGERRRLLRESKDPRVRLTGMLRMICGWVLLMGTLLFLVANYRMFSPTAVQSFFE